MNRNARRTASAWPTWSRILTSRRYVAAIAVLLFVQIPAQANGLNGSSNQPVASQVTVPTVLPAATPPGPEDTTGPVGMLPDGAFPAGAAVVAELPKLRTANSRTYLTETGSRVLMSYPGPVNYRDTNGVFQPIDDAATPSPDGSWHNAANSFQANVPSTLGQPVSVTSGSSTVSFALQGASSSVSPANVTALSPVAGSANGNRVTFVRGLPGTDVSYSFGNGGLEETLSLAANSSTDTYTSSLHVGADMSVRMTGAGSAEITNATGTVIMVVNTPSIEDANNLVGPVPTMSLSPDGSTMTVSLAPDAAWLRDPGRAFPVIVDPTISIPNSGSQCQMYQTVPNTVECSSATSYWIGAGSLTGNAHSMFRFDNLASDVPYDSLVQTANFDVYEQGAVNTTRIPINLGTVANKAWTTSATWNDYNSASSLAWTTAGGDFTTTPGTSPVTAGSANGWIGYTPVQQVQAWVNGEDLSQTSPPVVHNQGFMLTSDGAANAVSVTNWLSSSTSQWPYLSVQYMPRTGRGASMNVLKTALDDKTTLGVNAANGDLSIDTSLFNINGVGLPLALDLNYDSRGLAQTSMKTGTLGAGWALSPSFDQPQLIMEGGGVMDLVSSSGTNAVFTGENLAGQWTTSPPGLNATGGIVTSTTAQITFNQSHEVWNFTQIAGSTTTYHLTNIKDRNGNTVTYGYNTAGTQLTSITDTEGRVVSINYNANNLVSTITDSTGRQYVFSYVNLFGGFRVSTVVYGGKTTSYNYDSSGNLGQINGAAGSVTIMQYNSTHQATTVERITNVSTLAGESTHYSYSPGSASSPGAGVNTVTDPNSKVTSYAYDPWDRVTTVTDALGHARQANYNPQSSPQDLTNALTQITQLRNDTNNNLKSITAAPTSTHQTPAATTYMFNTPTTGTGMVAGGTYLASSSTDAQTNCSSFAYDANGNQTASYGGFAPGTLCDGMTSGTGVTSVQNAYQGDGTTACGGKPGELCSTTSGGGNVTSYSYDSLGQLIQIIQPGGSCSPRTVCTTITYDSLSRPLTVTDGKNQTTTYSYDAWDRITQILYNGTTTCSVSAGTCIQFGYDGEGNVTSRVDKTGATNFTYDLLNRLTEEALPSALNQCSGFSGIELTYDHASNLATYCDAGGAITYVYDAANRNIGVAYGTGNCTPGSIVQPCTVYNYDNANQLTGVVYPTTTGVTDTITPDGAGHVQQEHVTRNGSRSDLENVTSQYFTGTTDRSLRQATQNWLTSISATYSYDNYNRLTQSAGSGTGSSTYGYTYDGDGNMIRETVGFVPFTYTYSPSDSLCWGLIGASSNSCLSPPSGANTYTYDNNGNQTGSSSGEAISYNSVNQSTSMTSPSGGTAVSMAYTGTDSTERTTAGPTTIANSIFGVAESTTSGTNTFFTRNANGRLDHITIGGTVYFPYYDGAGSLAGLFDTSGNTAGTYTYDPYGGTTVTSGSVALSNPFRFKGGYQDSTGFYKFGTRYYNSTTASWTQADANQGTIQNPRTVNKFVYAGADPVNNVDPTGKFSLGDALSSVGSAVTGAIGVSVSDVANFAYNALACGIAGAAVGFAGAAVGAAYLGGVFGAVALGTIGFAVGCYAGIYGEGAP
jgi:RHS repeat-associated protein